GDTLTEEEETDALLTQLATKRVNIEAAKAPFANARVAPRAGEDIGGWNVGGLLAGILIGAAVALLYAPKSGENMRRDLQGTADDLRTRGEDLIERGRKAIHQQRERFSRA